MFGLEEIYAHYGYPMLILRIIILVFIGYCFSKLLFLKEGESYDIPADIYEAFKKIQTYICKKSN